MNNFLDLMTYIKDNNTGRDVDISMCEKVLLNYSSTSQNFIKDILTKTLRLGCDSKTVNKVYGKNFIPQYDVQQGSPRDKLRLKDNEVFFLTQKLNGVRGTYIKGELLSRQGIPFTGLDHIIQELKQIELNFGIDLVFDGELVRKNIDGIPDNENFRIGTGIINSDDFKKSSIEFILFDILPLAEFEQGESIHYYSERRDTLEKIFKDDEFYNLKLVNLLYKGADQLKIDELLEFADNQDWEGLMLNKDVPYFCKRHTGLVKIKTFKFSDLKITGYEEGSGKYAGTLGAVIVAYKGNSINVGSGFTDEQRNEYWANKDWLLGRICTVKYKEETSDKKTGLKSLQFPIFQCIRLDKLEESLES